MNYPLWDVPLIGGGLVIALIAIPHVFVSHFAVGGGLFLALSEYRARRDGNDRLLAFLKRNTLFFVLLTLVFGAVTGVGIWFAIGLVHPPATSTLIHNFVFGWAIEWVFFIVEISAALLYYYSWDRVGPKVHQIIGWCYAIAAWGSLVVINGILTFMLTPGDWLLDGTFWSGWANPGHIPSIIIRTAVAFGLAGLYAMFMASREEPGKDRDMLVRYAAKWLIPTFVILPLAGAWYVGILPPLAREISQGGAPAVTIFAMMSVGISAVIFIFAYFIAYRNPQSVDPAVAVLFLLLGLVVTGVTEWVREAVRKPYVIYDYMYSNGVRKDEVDRLREIGVLPTARWAAIRTVTPENALAAGEEVFILQCANCHTVDGYNGLRLLTKGWSEPFIEHQVRHLDELKGYMPPFAGSPPERRALAAWLASLNPGVRITRTAGPDSAVMPAEIVRGREVFDTDCAGCHTLHAKNPIARQVAGWSREYIAAQIARLDELACYAPSFRGTAEDRFALAAWLAELDVRDTTAVATPARVAGGAR